MKRRARAADELLAGRAISDGHAARRHVEVERLFGDLRTVAEHAPAPRPNAALVAALDGGRGRLPVFQLADDVQTLDTRDHERAAPLATLRRWLRPAIVPSAVAAILLGGLAGAGALPAPLQARDRARHRAPRRVDSRRLPSQQPDTPVDAEFRRARFGPRQFGRAHTRCTPFRDHLAVDSHTHAIVDEHASPHDGHEHAAVHACVARHARNCPADHRARNRHHGAAARVAAHADDTERAGPAEAPDHHGADDPAPAAALSSHGRQLSFDVTRPDT